MPDGSPDTTEHPDPQEGVPDQDPPWPTMHPADDYDGALAEEDKKEQDDQATQGRS